MKKDVMLAIETMLKNDETKRSIKEGNWEKVAVVALDILSEKDSGRFGKTWEITVKLYLNGYRGNSCKVSAKGMADLKYHGMRFEVKSNCGEINEDILKNDYILYTMDNEIDCYSPWNAKVIPADEFVEMLDNLGLIRTKKSTAGYMKKTIQSYRNSKRKTSLFEKALSEYPTLKEWETSH